MAIPALIYETNEGTLQEGFKIYNECTILPQNLPICYKQNKVFVGWYNESTFLTLVIPGIVISDEKTIYAKYVDKPEKQEYHIIIEKLRTWNYYLNKLPLYLQNSWGIDEHFYMLYELLTQLDNASGEILKCFDVFNSDFANFMLSTSDNIYSFDMLEKLARIYGVNRYLDIEYTENLVVYKKQLKLTNNELLTLLLSKIILNNFDGTYEQLHELYNKINLPIYIFTNISLLPTVYLYLDSSRLSTVSENILDLFKAGYFTLPSLGIKYECVAINISAIASWNSVEQKQFWNEGLWS